MPLPIKALLFALKLVPMRLWLPGLMVATVLGQAQSAERLFNNSRLYFSKIDIALIAGGKRSALAHLTCAEGFRVGGYQFIPPATPVPSYPDDLAPVTIMKTNYTVLNDWTLELLNNAEPPRPPFPLTIAFVCVDTSKS